ncbi:hypothetical protein VP01_637g16 [Puccinia sorghi]|uniref:Uncharacterized protein n=1 Tax=Puccinia sorghi TaxID=27349 RepID=A0A0L6UFZ7_9BASI|nr:hypothetical protein VP01_637g16 [Puccinia sorghi]
MEGRPTSWTEAETRITTEAYHVKMDVPAQTSLPDFLFHFTRLTQSMLVWIGSVSTDPSTANLPSAPHACLANDWSCSVPPSSRFPAISTRLNSCSPTDAFSQTLAQKIGSIAFPSVLLNSEKKKQWIRKMIRFCWAHHVFLAQRFKIQVFVSIDIPSSILASNSRIKFELEKQLFGHIQAMLSTKST